MWMGTREETNMPKFTTRTYTESVEFIGKIATLPGSNVDSEIATIAYIYQQDLFKVGKDVIKFANKWNKLINKSV
jgi:hypothetical protein